jgi:hypothetical protein
MECPYCGAELIYDEEYGTGRHESFYGTAGNGIHYPSTYKKIGDIYYCPNREGFENINEAEQYKNSPEGIDQQELRNEDVICDSSTFNRFFYTDSNDNLKEGYPY